MQIEARVCLQADYWFSGKLTRGISPSESALVLIYPLRRHVMSKAYALASVSSPGMLLSQYLGEVWTPQVGSL